MLNRKSVCYVFVGRYAIWVVFRARVVHAEISPRALTVSHIIKKCSRWKCSKIVLFLEFPWVLLNVQVTIPLSRNDAFQYSRNVLGFHHSTADKFSKIGICFFELTEKNRKGLLSAALPPQTLKLIDGLKKNKRVKVEPVPLLCGYLPQLLKMASDVIFFRGIRQTVFLTKKKQLLEKITILPEASAKEGGTKIIGDFLDVVPEGYKTVYLSNQAAESEDKASLSILTTTRQWKGMTKNSNPSFEWETPELSWKTNWKWLAAAGGVGIMGILFFWYFSLQETNTNLQQQISRSLQKIQEDQTKIEHFKVYARQREHFIQMNTIYQHLKRMSVVAKKSLEQLIAPMDRRVWIEYLNYSDQQLDLSLMALDANVIPDVLEQLAATPATEKIQLKSQEIVQIEQQDVVKIILRIDLKTEEAKPILRFGIE